MNRRSLLTHFLGKPKVETSTKTKSTVITTLTPFSGIWTFENAAHLLRRTTFGPTYQNIKESVSDGLEATVAKLLVDTPLPALPINHSF